MKEKFTPLDIAEHLNSSELQDGILKDALESGDAKYIALALGTVARARAIHGKNDMGHLANEVGMTRSGLYKALSKDGNPRLTTLLGVIQSLGLKLSIERVDPV